MTIRQVLFLDGPVLAMSLAVLLLMLYGGIEQGDSGRHPRSSRVNLRKRIIGFVFLILGVLMLTMYAYVRSTFLGSTHWVVFWGYEAIIGAGLVVAVVETIRKRSRS